MPYPRHKSDIETLAEAGIQVDTLIAAAADFVRRQSLDHAQSPQTNLSQEEQEILRQGGAPDAAFEPASASISTKLIAEYSFLVARALPPTLVAERLGINLDQVLQRIDTKSLYAIDTPEGWVCPLWQFQDIDTLPRLKTLLKAMSPTVHPVGVQRFFNSPNADLEIDVNGESVQLTPIQWLNSGRPVDDLLLLVKDL